MDKNRLEQIAIKKAFDAKAAAKFTKGKDMLAPKGDSSVNRRVTRVDLIEFTSFKPKELFEDSPEIPAFDSKIDIIVGLYETDGTDGPTIMARVRLSEPQKKQKNMF